MPVDLLKNIADTVPHDMALLGLDVGKKTIGLAVCDPGRKVATPLHTLRRTKFTQDVQALAEVINEYEIGGLVIGLPLNMDGSKGRQAQAVRDFALELAKKPEVVGHNPWIALWDERLSTVSVEDIVDNMVEKRKTKIKSKESGLVDKLAAQIILQNALDFLRTR